MDPGILYAIIAATVFGLWTVFHELASTKVDTLFGAIMVSLTAVLVGTAMILPKLRTTTFYTDPKGILYITLAGVCALAIDYFALKAYSSGLSISVAGPIIISGSIAIAATIGFIMGESVTAGKLVGLFLILVGSAVLAAHG